MINKYDNNPGIEIESPTKCIAKWTQPLTRVGEKVGDCRETNRLKTSKGNSSDKIQWILTKVGIAVGVSVGVCNNKATLKQLTTCNLSCHNREGNYYSQMLAWMWDDQVCLLYCRLGLVGLINSRESKFVRSDHFLMKIISKTYLVRRWETLLEKNEMLRQIRHWFTAKACSMHSNWKILTWEGCWEQCWER